MLVSNHVSFQETQKVDLESENNVTKVNICLYAVLSKWYLETDSHDRLLIRCPLGYLSKQENLSSIIVILINSIRRSQNIKTWRWTVPYIHFSFWKVFLPIASIVDFRWDHKNAW